MFETFDEIVKRQPTAYAYFTARWLAPTKTSRVGLRDFDASLRLSPNDPRALANRAAVKVGRKDFKGALADCDLALRLKPRSVFLLATCAEIKRAAGDIFALGTI